MPLDFAAPNTDYGLVYRLLLQMKPHYIYNVLGYIHDVDKFQNTHNLIFVYPTSTKCTQ